MDRPEVVLPGGSPALRRSLDELETPRFAAEVGVASSVKLAAEIVRRHPVFHSIMEQARSDPDSMREVLARLHRLAVSQSDENLENPWETALFALLLIIAAAEPKLTTYAAGVAAAAPRTWWTVSLARRLLGAAPTATTARHVVSRIDLGVGPAKPRAKRGGTSAPIQHAVLRAASVVLAASFLTPATISKATKAASASGLSVVVHISGVRVERGALSSQTAVDGGVR
jgi:hypothetical protein